MLSVEDESSTYQRYFKILDSYENELCTVGTETQRDRAGDHSSATEDYVREQTSQHVERSTRQKSRSKHGNTSGSLKRAQAKGKGKHRDDNPIRQAEQQIRVTEDAGDLSEESSSSSESSNDSATSSESSNDSASSSESSDRSSITTHRKKRVKLDF
ncbi:hypothetical protein OG21DRAFT_1489886 [Imleria badia]|nr:hypothetical protein OG21DRAFT_1489886 [Imleria badia]